RMVLILLFLCKQPFRHQPVLQKQNIEVNSDCYGSHDQSSGAGEAKLRYHPGGGCAMLVKLQIPTLLVVTVMGFAVPGWRPSAAFGQGTEARVQVLSPGVHNQRLPRTGEPAIHYAISIPANYPTSRPVPLVLALHYGGDPN